MLYDAFMFSNELDLLEIRLHELSNIVDKFVLVEATKTHTGKDKLLYYWENRHLFWKFQDMIIPVIIDDMPITEDEIRKAISPQDLRWIESGYQIEDHWVRERYQRNAMMRVLDSVDPDDIIMISDADEIPRASAVKDAISSLCPGSTALHQSLNTCYINWRCTNMEWYGTKILRRKDISTPSEDRFHTKANCYVENGGWHYNFLGGAEKIKQKIQSYAHQEFNIDEVLDNIQAHLNNHTDVLGRLYQYEIIPINEETTPKYILENLERFDYLVYHETNN